MIEIEIDGKKLEVAEGSMIIEAADDANIHIPRFCYHKKLSVAANCRMCLVEVEKSGKPLPACATPVTSGMKVHTQSKKALEAQKAVMEFLLINHPLDCPICDQGGQCELQDVAVGYGRDVSRYNEGKRAVDDDDFGSLIATDMTRCIHCTRCVRFGEEIAGVREIGATGRGEHMQIGTYIKHSLTSELSGNIIDVCPVGALTSKPFRFRARAWELQQQASVSPHDCIGSNLYLHTWHGKVMRVVPRENEKINETWLSDRDRFSYVGLNSEERALVPLLKQSGKWQQSHWADALQYTVEQLRKVVTRYGADQIGVLVSPNATTEEFYLLQKLMRAAGCHNIDHRIRQEDFSDQNNYAAYPGLGCQLQELESKDFIMLLGCDVQRQQPMASLKIRKASLKQAKVVAINAMDYDFHFSLTEKIIVPPLQLPSMLAGILNALLAATPTVTLPANIMSALHDITPTEKATAIAKLLLASENGHIILGELAQNHPHAATISQLVNLIARVSNTRFGFLTTGCNSAGAWLAGSVPHRMAASVEIAQPGLSAKEMVTNQLKAYVLFNVEPELDCANPQAAIMALAQADFVVSLSPFQGGVLDAHADVILPITPFSENEGSVVNVEGQWQTFSAAVAAAGEARPAWKVLRVLANLWELPEFDYTNVAQVSAELQGIIQNARTTHEYKEDAILEIPALKALTRHIWRITEWPMYRTDSLVRRSQPLQQAAANTTAQVVLSAGTAHSLGVVAAEVVQVVQAENSVELPVQICESVPPQCAFIAGGFSKTAKLGDSFGEILIKKIG